MKTEDTEYRKRLIIELIKIKVNTGQPINTILTKITRNRFKHWNWPQVVETIENHYYRQCEPETEEERAAAEETAAMRIHELKQNY